MEEKVIEFPKSKVVREIPEEHLKARKDRMNQKVADAISEDISGIVLTELDNNGVDVETEGFMKDFVLTNESIKACVYRFFGIEHYLHNYEDNHIKIIQGGDLSDMNPDEIRQKIETVIDELRKAKESIDNSDDE